MFVMYLVYHKHRHTFFCVLVYITTDANIRNVKSVKSCTLHRSDIISWHKLFITSNNTSCIKTLSHIPSLTLLTWIFTFYTPLPPILCIITYTFTLVLQQFMRPSPFLGDWRTVVYTQSTSYPLTYFTVLANWSL